MQSTLETDLLDHEFVFKRPTFGTVHPHVLKNKHDSTDMEYYSTILNQESLQCQLFI